MKQIVLQWYFCVAALTVIQVPVSAAELAVDFGYADAEWANSWGMAGHLQLMLTERWGLNLGYQYQSQMAYTNSEGPTQHFTEQLEGGLIWQKGRDNGRFQLIAEGTLVNFDSREEDKLLGPFVPGARFSMDLSAPLAPQFRLFSNLGYDWTYKDALPRRWSWRYGFRLSLAGASQGAQPMDMAPAEPLAEPIEAEPLSVDDWVPLYMPSQLSQSLPAIIKQARLSKCFPTGPYSLELGEFDSLEQAVSALEFRGLRAFFNSIIYARDPQPIFIAQANWLRPVKLFLGDFTQPDQGRIWQQALARVGIEAKPRELIHSSTARQNCGDETLFQPTQVQPTQIPAPKAPVGTVLGASPSIPNTTEAEPNAIDAKPEITTKIAADQGLVIGPVSQASVRLWLSQARYRDALLDEESAVRRRLVWDAMQQRAWLYVDNFNHQEALQRWQNDWQSSPWPVQQENTGSLPLGDVYTYLLGALTNGDTLELAHQTSVDEFLSVLTSAELLWFQAYYAVRQQPLQLIILGSADNVTRLVVTGFSNNEMMEQAWQQLSDVELMPALNE